MPKPANPLDSLSRQELIWLTGILKDACRERLEKNLVNQEFEERLYRRGPVAGRLDPRPFLKIWEPRYRKFLAAASELQALLESEDAQAAVESLKARFRMPEPETARRARASERRSGESETPPQSRLHFDPPRREPQPAQTVIEFGAPRSRKTRSR
jgi:hypothetical protein